jgi:DNA-binding NarL/FixJ family response regulator
MESAHQNTSRARILIADDHAIFAESLRAYLEKASTVIGVVATVNRLNGRRRAQATA